VQVQRSYGTGMRLASGLVVGRLACVQLWSGLVMQAPARARAAAQATAAPEVPAAQRHPGHSAKARRAKRPAPGPRKEYGAKPHRRSSPLN